MVLRHGTVGISGCSMPLLVGREGIQSIIYTFHILTFRINSNANQSMYGRFMGLIIKLRIWPLKKLLYLTLPTYLDGH